MSECIICKGNKTIHFKKKILIVELDDFLRKQANRIWDKNDEIWTIKFMGKDIDFYLTEAQNEINSGIPFEKTEFYMIINELLSHNVRIAMWYDTYCENLPMCRSKMDIFSACYEGITDVSGMCEVYFMMN